MIDNNTNDTFLVELKTYEMMKQWKGFQDVMINSDFDLHTHGYDSRDTVVLEKRSAQIVIDDTDDKKSLICL